MKMNLTELFDKVEQKIFFYVQQIILDQKK